MSIQQNSVSLFLEDIQASLETPEIEGYLESLIIESDNKVEIIIESSLGYVVFSEKDFMGIRQFLPRQNISAQGLTENLSFDKFLLNESLIITVIGPKKTTVSFSIRYNSR